MHQTVAVCEWLCKACNGAIPGLLHICRRHLAGLGFLVLLRVLFGRAALLTTCVAACLVCQSEPSLLLFGQHHTGICGLVFYL
jgi:hypothetical protein